MKILRAASCGLLLLALAACYGTRVHAPERSSLPPAGLYTLTEIKPLPAPLADLLVVYKQSLIEQAAHQMSAKSASDFADAEIRSLERKYAGQEEPLRAEVIRRLQNYQPRAPGTPGQQAGRYPQDPEASQERGRQ